MHNPADGYYRLVIQKRIEMMKKKILQTICLAAMIGMCVSFPAAAEEKEALIPMEQLDVRYDAEGAEDGEELIENYGADVESKGFVRFRYLSSGVHSTYYAATEIQGIDVSRHQKYINWEQVKASGMDFAMIRVGYRGYGTGVICADEYFEQNVQNALAAGMKVGIYFFSQALTEQEAREEASYTVNMIQKYHITYPVVFDWETAPGYRTYDVSMSKSYMNSLADAFCGIVEGQGYIPMVYSNTSDFTNRFDYDSIAAKYYIWYARYPSCYGGNVWYSSGDRLPNYDNNIQFNMWQYMSDGTVPGVNGNCDVNVTFLDFGIVREPVEVPLTASSSKIVINNSENIITGMEAGSAYSDLRASFDQFYVTINGNSEGSSEDEVLKTGDKLVFAPKAENTYLKNTSYTLAIKGDVDGNGNVNVVDMECIQRQLLGLNTLDSVQLAAAKTGDENSLSVLDMERIQKHLLGLGSLY